MKFFPLAVAVQLLFLLVKGIDGQDGGKRIVCYYEPGINYINHTLLPEDIDASLCTHLICFRAEINHEIGQIELIGSDPYAGKDYMNRVLKLKENNPELKVLLYLKLSCFNPWISRKSGWSSLINNIIEFLKLHGFDGLKIFTSFDSFEDCISEILCEMRAEFDKQGFIITKYLPPINIAVEVDQDYYNKNRCYNFFIVPSFLTGFRASNVTALISPLASVKSLIDVYLAKGFPSNKLLVLISAFGMITKLKSLNDTGIGAEIEDPGSGNTSAIKYNKMVEKISDPSEQWTIRRDEATNSTYGFNKHGQWASYDDPSSVATKAQYVVQNKLGGAAIIVLDSDDFMGIGGEGTFPLTRKLHEIIVEGKENETHSSDQ